ncbi:MAG: hypothetical protein JXA33_23285 [Anaerolineae bacterium]|nr:hypothetical protein [Anaerolineae bacterium]
MLRLLFLVLYVGGFIFLQDYIRRHPPKLSSTYLEPGVRPFWVLLWWFGPSLLPVMAILWSGILPVSPIILFLLGLFVPIAVYAIFFLWLGAFKSAGPGGLLVISLLFIMISLPFLLLAETSFLLIFLFLMNLVLPPLITLAWIFLWAPAMLPITPEQATDIRKVLAHFTGFFTTYPKSSLVVVKGKVQTRIPGNPFLGTGPGLIVTEPENVAVIKASSKIGGFAGPGPAFTEANETVESVIDLRQQLRGTKVKAMTRDGITVELPISSIFRIDAGQNSPKLGEPWPYHSSAAYTALFAAEVNPEGKTPLDAHHSRPWEDLPLEVATHKLKQVVSRYSLDELYGTLGRGATTLPRAALGKEVRQYVINELEPKGIKIDGGGVGNKIKPVDSGVTQQRIDTWKAQWIQKVMENMGLASAERYSTLQRAQSEVWAEFLQGFIKQSEALKKAGDSVSATLMTLQLLETLEQIARDPKVRPLLPESAQSTMKGLRMRIADNGEAGKKQEAKNGD